MNVWVGIYHHRHGIDCAVFTAAPTQDHLAKYWERDYEPDREDEYFEVYGPLEPQELPKLGKKRGDA